ncbi:MAG TPA: L,D-transpeptidase family protein [Longimicrobiales bacterium]|nr:L,D-transpeptidase family protein [Longimicrobiales bacterium]
MPGWDVWRKASGLAALVVVLVPALAAGQLARDLGLIPADTDAPLVALLPTETSFALEQLRYERVEQARVATRHNIKLLFHERGIPYPAAEIFLRVFKRERSLELWVRGQDRDRFELLKIYDICAMAGALGPKRKQGDNQTPEGFYHISFFNPRSEYHLSLHVNYPNARDRAAGLAGISLGGDIYIHGGCSSEGCLAITDEGIRELYWLSVEARSGGQQRIPVHIFPARLETRDLQILQQTFGEEPELGRFWATLKPAYDYFEEHRQLPGVVVNGRGEYALVGSADDVVAEQESAAPAVRVPAGPRPLGSPVGGGSPH